MTYNEHERCERYVAADEGRWLICLDCGASWSIVDTSQGEALERIDEGDGYCGEQ